MQLWEEYIKAVKTGQRNAGELEKLSIKHVGDLSRRFEFDEAEAERIINIVHLFRHTKGKWKGQHFNLLPHQAFFLAYLFGLKNEKGHRLIREAMLNMAKKGGKSELAGTIGVLYTFFDTEQTAQGYVVANKTEQALFAWNAAKSICLQLKHDFPDDFASDLKFYDNKQEHTLIKLSAENFFKTLPYSNSDLDGVDPHIAIVDEFHEYPDTSVPDNLQSGMILRDQPLLLYTTTRGFHPYGPLAEKEEYYENVLKGLVNDSRVFPLIFSLDDDNNWKNKNYWIQFAPGVDYDLPSYRDLEDFQKAALDEGGEKLVNTKTKNFNIWQRSKSVFVDQRAWDSGGDPIDEESLIGRECWTAFDIGRTDDLSVFGHFFPPVEEGERYKFLMRAFMPGEMVERRSREHKVSYRQWIDEGLVIKAEGNYTDTTIIGDHIRADAEKFKYRAVYADQTFAIELINQLDAEGFTVNNFPQRYAPMTAPILFIQKLINSGQFQHGGNKVLSWMCSNATIKKNTGGQMMLDKSDRITGKGKDHKKGRKKIDGMVVLVMCAGGFLNEVGEKKKSVYEERGLLSI